jgi:hypothetical protein
LRHDGRQTDPWHHGCRRRGLVIFFSRVPSMRTSSATSHFPASASRWPRRRDSCEFDPVITGNRMRVLHPVQGQRPTSA